MTVVYGECAPSYATVKRWAAKFCHLAETALKMSPGRDIRLKLSVKKTVVLLKILYCIIVESMCS